MARMFRCLAFAVVTLAGLVGFSQSPAQASIPDCRTGTSIRPYYGSLYYEAGGTIKACFTLLPSDVVVGITPSGFRVTPTPYGAEVQVAGAVCVEWTCVSDPSFTVDQFVRPDPNWFYAGADVAPCARVTAPYEPLLDYGLLCVNAGGPVNQSENDGRKAYAGPGLCVSRTYPSFRYTCLRIMSATYADGTPYVRQYNGVCETEGWDDYCWVETRLVCRMTQPSATAAESQAQTDPVPFECTETA